MEKVFEKIEEEIGRMFQGENSGHDIHHLRRVFNNALALQTKEGGDVVVIGSAALLHDIHRLIQKEIGKFCSPVDSLPNIREILDKTDLTSDIKDKILHCVEYHEEYDFSVSGKTVKDIETLVLQDADNLDAIGAIGIGRTFTFGGAHGLPMWEPAKPFDREVFDESQIDPSTAHHFYSKLLKLKDNMNTKTAKKMAKGRHVFMEKFLGEFFDEWGGKK